MNVGLMLGEDRLLRLLRGRVIIREDLKADTDHYKRIIVPDVLTTHDKDAVARARTWHRGRVLAFGAPALTKRGAEVAQDFAVGDVVLFHWAHAEKMWTFDWGGERVCAVPQECVDAVIEEGPPS